MAVEAISTPDVVDSAHVPALGKTAVEVCDLVKTFDNGAVRALDGVSFAVPEGQLLVIIGLSGSGKSTLLRHLNGLHLPSEGSVTVLEQNVPNLNRTDLRNLRKEVGFVFQQFNIVGRLTCIENVLTGTLGRLKGPRIGASMYPKKLRKEAIEQLERVGLAERAWQRSLHQVDLALGWADRLIGLRDGKIVLDTPVDDSIDQQSVMGVYRELDPGGEKRAEYSEVLI